MFFLLLEPYLDEGVEDAREEAPTDVAAADEPEKIASLETPFHIQPA